MITNTIRLMASAKLTPSAIAEMLVTRKGSNTSPNWTMNAALCGRGTALCPRI